MGLDLHTAHQEADNILTCPNVLPPASHPQQILKHSIYPAASTSFRDRSFNRNFVHIYIKKVSTSCCHILRALGSLFCPRTAEIFGKTNSQSPCLRDGVCTTADLSCNSLS